MDPDFWHQRWQQGDVPFHCPDFNTHLQRFWAQLGLARGSRVFVPLCGKSRDMMWLATRGHGVLGVEISPVAVEEFFHDHGLVPRVGWAGVGLHWSDPCERQILMKRCRG